MSEIGNENLNIDLGELKKQTQASRVLYVEDDPISATIMQKVLGDLFKEVLYFSNVGKISIKYIVGLFNAVHTSDYFS